jgi:2-polyprenyl-3-methyl-5-hydroxy-6-metoxy-1,4-benzoquinol methylase
LGELFHRTRPSRALDWTGERLVTDVGGGELQQLFEAGPIESEHLHRYFVARELCRGKDVLDIASGEGYGAALLAQTSARVIGVELDPESVQHASREYRSANLQYLNGEATRLPVESQSIDVVVSFETLEHLFEHEIFLAEVCRVLRPNGFLVISTPNVDVYSCAGMPPNPFHVRELSRSDFSSLLHSAFSRVSFLRQRVITGSAILSEESELGNQSWVYEQRDADTFESGRLLPRAPYLLAVASNDTIPAVGTSLFIQADNPRATSPEVQTELERLRGVEAAYRGQEPAIAEALAKCEGAREDAARLVEANSSMRLELERLGDVEIRAREQAETLTRAQADLVKAREERRSVEEQFNTAALLARQQALVLRRLQIELGMQAQAFRETREVLDQVAGLIIPVWMRKLVPDALRKPVRAIKRALSSA